MYVVVFQGPEWFLQGLEFDWTSRVFINLKKKISWKKKVSLKKMASLKTSLKKNSQFEEKL